MAELFAALGAAVSFDSFVRFVELGVLLYMIRILNGMSSKISDLHKWHDHDVVAAPGTKIWWVDPRVLPCLMSMEKHLEKIAGAAPASAEEATA